MKSLLIILAALLGAAQAISLFDQAEDEWRQFKAEHQKVYSDETEERSRREIWSENRDIIAKHNKMNGNFKLAMNKYGDMPRDEFKPKMKGIRPRLEKRSIVGTVGSIVSNLTGLIGIEPDNDNLPQYVDWRQKGYVTGVKEQKQLQCNSGWAFSTTGSLEGQNFRKTGKLVSLSEQNLVDCSMTEGNEGCKGGQPDQAFDYIKKNGGIDTDESYTYEARDGNCRYNKTGNGAVVTGFVDIRSGDEDELKKAVATVGPISAVIDASSIHFQFYSGGVYDPWFGCSSTELDHAVLVVGYGHENGKDYWLVKNSYGTSWGQQGYIKMSRNRSNMCGIATQASYPLV